MKELNLQPLQYNDEDDDKYHNSKDQEDEEESQAEDKIWEIVRVGIPIAEEEISCHLCSKNMAVSWASNLNPEDN